MQFCRCVLDMPEVVGFYRMAGQIDYLLHVVVPEHRRLRCTVYNRLIAQIELYDVSASFAMEVLKSTTALPLDYAHCIVPLHLCDGRGARGRMAALSLLLPAPTATLRSLPQSATRTLRP